MRDGARYENYYRINRVRSIDGCLYQIGCSASLPQANRLEGPKTYQGAVDIRINGFRRTYLVGFSNGGMLVYRFAAERGDLLAAIAPLAASIGGKPAQDVPEWRIPEPVKPRSVITIHGLADDDIPYEGGVSRHRGGTRTYWPVEDVVGFWVNRDGCDSQPVTRTMRGESVLIKTWENCNNDTTVALWLIKGWGHVWPGKYFTADLDEDDPLKNFDAAEIIWDFFKSRLR